MKAMPAPVRICMFLCAAALTGCVAVPVEHGSYGVYVSPPPPPVVVVRPYSRGYYGHHRRHRYWR